MSLLDSIVGLASNDTVERAYKTFLEVSAAQAAAYTTIVPNSPGVKTSALVSAGATFLSIVWNALKTWVANSKNAKLAALADAIDKAVAVRLAVQQQAQAQNALGVPQHQPPATSA
jgi:hypothetical protein